jgi:hypothetical protein
MDLKR